MNNKKIAYKVLLEGGYLQNKILHDMLKASYTDIQQTPVKIGDYILDKELSVNRVKVYYRIKNRQVVIAVRGTDEASDWYNNAVYGLGGEKSYKNTDRFKEVEKIHKEVVNKYKGWKITNIGHSQGKLAPEFLGVNDYEVITLNGATRPSILKTNYNKNQYDIIVDGDAVSRLNPFDLNLFNKSHKIKIKPIGKSGLLESHKIENLMSEDPSKLWGRNEVYDVGSIPIPESLLKGGKQKHKKPKRTIKRKIIKKLKGGSMSGFLLKILVGQIRANIEKSVSKLLKDFFKENGLDIDRYSNLIQQRMYDIIENIKNQLHKNINSKIDGIELPQEIIDDYEIIDPADYENYGDEEPEFYY